jgi:hypothetical protein
MDESPIPPVAEGPAAARNLGHTRIPIVVERLLRGPEKAGVGGSTPSLATTFQSS